MSRQITNEELQEMKDLLDELQSVAKSVIDFQMYIGKRRKNIKNILDEVFDYNINILMKPSGEFIYRITEVADRLCHNDDLYEYDYTGVNNSKNEVR